MFTPTRRQGFRCLCYFRKYVCLQGVNLETIAGHLPCFSPDYSGGNGAGGMRICFWLGAYYWEIPQKLAASILQFGSSPTAFLFIVNIILLIAGMFIDGTAAITILVPLFTP